MAFAYSEEPWFDSRQGQDSPETSRPSPGANPDSYSTGNVDPFRGSKVATRLNLDPEVKNEWSCTSTPICFLGVHREKPLLFVRTWRDGDRRQVPMVQQSDDTCSCQHAWRMSYSNKENCRGRVGPTLDGLLVTLEAWQEFETANNARKSLTTWSVSAAYTVELRLSGRWLSGPPNIQISLALPVNVSSL